MELLLRLQKEQLLREVELESPSEEDFSAEQKSFSIVREDFFPNFENKCQLCFLHSGLQVLRAVPEIMTFALSRRPNDFLREIMKIVHRSALSPDQLVSMTEQRHVESLMRSGASKKYVFGEQDDPRDVFENIIRSDDRLFSLFRARVLTKETVKTVSRDRLFAHSKALPEWNNVRKSCLTTYQAKVLNDSNFEDVVKTTEYVFIPPSRGVSRELSQGLKDNINKEALRLRIKTAATIRRMLKRLAEKDHSFKYKEMNDSDIFRSAYAASVPSKITTPGEQDEKAVAIYKENFNSFKRELREFLLNLFGFNKTVDISKVGLSPESLDAAERGDAKIVETEMLILDVTTGLNQTVSDAIKEKFGIVDKKIVDAAPNPDLDRVQIERTRTSVIFEVPKYLLVFVSRERGDIDVTVEQLLLVPEHYDKDDIKLKRWIALDFVGAVLYDSSSELKFGESGHYRSAVALESGKVAIINDFGPTGPTRELMNFVDAQAFPLNRKATLLLYRRQTTIKAKTMRFTKREVLRFRKAMTDMK